MESQPSKRVNISKARALRLQSFHLLPSIILPLCPVSVIVPACVVEDQVIGRCDTLVIVLTRADHCTSLNTLS